MYKDIISYRLAEGVTEEQLVHVAQTIIESWMSKQPGFIKWEIHTSAKGEEYTDIVYWESKEDAKKAEADMVNIPNVGEWYACYEKGSISSKNLEQITSFT